MSSETNKILTTDGIPLEVSLKKAERKNKIKAFLLVAPLLLFLLITYVFPIGDMLMRSVDDKMVTEMLPKTFKAMEKWDGKELPEEEVFEAFYLDFRQLVDEKREGKLSTQLNYTKNGYGRKRDDTTKNIHAQERKQDDIIINELTLLNLLSSRSSKSEMQEGLENLWAYSMYYGSQYSDVSLKDENDKSIYPIYPVTDYQLYSTPLNHTIIAAMDLVPQFKKDTGIQKVHSVFLTDGYSNSIDRKYEFTDEIHPLETKPDDWKGEIKGTYIPSDRDTSTIVTDPVTKKKYIQSEDNFDKYGYAGSFDDILSNH